jgi:hypothetical protein
VIVLDGVLFGSSTVHRALRERLLDHNQLELSSRFAQDDALEARIRAEGLASLVGELRQQGERMAA